MKPPLFSCLTSRVANNGSLYGRFLLGPLPIDISLTVATVLRRSLLHSQASFTIVSAEIDGASHEYASLPGIQESVLEILLNLGEIVLGSPQGNFLSPNLRTSIGTRPFNVASIRVSGPGVVRAKDINWPKGIVCVKPDSYIATLSSNETLAMRIKIACSLSKHKKPFYEIPRELAEPLTSFSPLTTQESSKINSSIESASESENKENPSSSLTSSIRPVAEQLEDSATSNTLLEFEFFKGSQSNSQLTEFSNSSGNSTLSSNGITIQKQNLKLAKHRISLDPYSTRKAKLRALPFFRSTEKEDIYEESILAKSKTNSTNVENIVDPTKKNSVTFSVFSKGVNSSTNMNSTNNIADSGDSFSDISLQKYSQEEEEILKEEPNVITEQSELFNKEGKNFTENNKKSVELAVSSSSYPVEKVNFLIERDDELVGYRHRIILEVWTNGSISPRQAIFDSIGSIIKLIYNFREPLRNYFRA